MKAKNKHKESRNTSVRVTLSARENEMLNELAAAAGLTRSDWVRQAIRRVAFKEGQRGEG